VLRVTVPDQAHVTRGQILLRGLRNRCPNCGEAGLFAHGLTLHKACPRCGLEFELGEGFFLGSMSINYGVTICVYLVPVLILYLTDVLSAEWAGGLAIAGTIFFPILFYRSSRSWWLMAYFYFLPHLLPANRRELARDEDANV
jgi:uncharacterized protein (DUF983 family)